PSPTNPMSRLAAFGLLAVALGFSGQFVCGQQPSQPLDLPPPVTQSAANESPVESSDEDELGELVFLRGPARPKLFRVTSDTQYLFTSNILLLPDRPPLLRAEQDSLLLQTFGVSVSPQLLDKLTSTVYLRYQLARYSAHDEFDFDSQTAGLQLSYPVEDWFNAYVSLRAFTDYGYNDSNFRTRTYHVFDVGGGLNLSVRF